MLRNIECDKHKIPSTSFKHLFDTEVWICYYHTRYHAISYHFFRQPNILDFHHDCLGCQKPNLCNHFQKERHCSPKPNFLPGKQSHSNENYTVWKFHNFSAIQILSEINFGKCRVWKLPLRHFQRPWTLILENFSSEKLLNFSKVKNQHIENTQNCNFWGSETLKIDFM